MMIPTHNAPQAVMALPDSQFAAAYELCIHPKIYPPLIILLMTIW